MSLSRPTADLVLPVLIIRSWKNEVSEKTYKELGKHICSERWRCSVYWMIGVDCFQLLAKWKGVADSRIFNLLDKDITRSSGMTNLGIRIWNFDYWPHQLLEQFVQDCRRFFTENLILIILFWKFCCNSNCGAWCREIIQTAFGDIWL